MAFATRRHRAAPDIWPGFVDAIAALLIIMIFVLIVFALAQFFLSADLSSRNDALQRLNREVSELADMLSIERCGFAFAIPVDRRWWRKSERSPADVIG